jgi:hypothetical protein
LLEQPEQAASSLDMPHAKQVRFLELIQLLSESGRVIITAPLKKISAGLNGAG